MIRSLAALMTLAAAGPAPAETGPAKVEFFEQRIRPVLAEHCYHCHSAKADRLRGGLNLDSREGLLRGGDTGPAIETESPDHSLLLLAISYHDPDLQMPPKSRLADDVVSHFRTWLHDGAVWPKVTETPPADAIGQDGFDLAARRASHWAWQTLRPTEPPPVHDETWPKHPIDRFVLQALENQQLRPASHADKRTLIRRASLLLTGLPPTPAEVEAFAADGSDQAFSRVVDRLLASPHFGERWARHWLDKVRYAETMGHEFDYPILGAWRYRDYVVRAFNADVPFHAFAREQVAGDLIPEPRRNPADGGNESLLGTTQFWLGQQVHSPVDVRSHQLEVTDNQIDVITKSFLGLTVSCARCHDHKFDAISTKDYYALYGILTSSRPAIRAVDDPAPRIAQATALAKERDRLRLHLASQLEELLSAEPSPITITNNHTNTIALRTGDREIPLANWFPDGEAFAADQDASGQPVFLNDTSTPLLSVVTPGSWHSASLSRKFQGALRSPAVVLTNHYLHLRLAGQGARVNVVLEGFTLIRAPIYGSLRQAVQNPHPHWISIDVSMWQGRRAWIELADFSVDDPASELGADAAKPDGWITVDAAITSPHRDPPPLTPAAAPPNGLEVVRRWASSPGSLSPTEAAFIEALIALTPALLLSPDLTTLRQLEETVREPVLVSAMADADGWDEPVFIRGNHRSPGEPAPRRFLEALNLPNLAPIECGSGRRELAEAITHPDNPLFARVTVNWIWAHLFGRGLVASADNFGALGEQPSHPELLDWLANEFIQSGWSTKSLIRQLVLSQTWQMRTTNTDPTAETVDPDNALLHRAHLRRLDGESLRDTMLAVSGRLDPRLGGPSIPVHLTPFMDGRGRPANSGPLDGNGRRSLYLEVRRNFLSPMMLAFDTPVPASTVGRRTISNVPAQALILMNDPFVAQQAQHWAERVRHDIPTSPAERIERLYLEAFARQPLPEELAAAQDFLAAQPTHPDDNEDAAWAHLCHALLNLKEFLFLN